MNHTFSYKDDYYILDTESGAIHALDRTAYDILNCVEAGADPFAAFPGQYAEHEIEEVLKEAEALKKQGLLSSECLYDVKRPVFNVPVVKSLCLHVAHDCNLRCAYCFGDKGAFFGEKALMPLKTAKRALLFLVENSGKKKHLEVDFFGGEPLLNFPTVKEAVAYGHTLEKEYGKEIRFTMTTNAYHVTDEMADFINAEMKNLVISLDGRKEIHDALRKNAAGHGSYDAVLKNAKKIVAGRGGKEYYIRGTFTKRNLDFAKDVEAIIDEGFAEVSLEPVVTGLDIAIGREDIPRVLHEYGALAELYEKREEEGRPFHFFHFTVDISSGPCLNKRLRGCGAGSEYLAVAPNGDLYPCHQFVGKKEFLMGNVHTGTVNRDIKNAFMDCHVFAKEKCSACWAKYYCSGGCAANAWNMNGDLKKPYETGCELEKKRIEIALALQLKDKGKPHTGVEK